MPARNKESCAPAKPHRILMTVDTVGGVWTYGLELARSLATHDVQIALATMGARLDRLQRRQISELSNVELFESTFKLEWMAEPWEDIRRAGNWLLQLEQQVQPDLVHLNNFAHASLPWHAPKIVVGHSCVLSWWRAVKGCNAPAEWSRYAAAVGKGIRAADLVIAPTHAMLNDLDLHYGPLPDNRVIYNGRTSALFHTRVKENIILTVGRLWDEGKNIPALAAVSPHLPWRIYVAGANRHPEGAIQNTGALLPLGKLSPEKISAWLGRASIYAAPAFYEPFGLSILEAALSGCSLVLGDTPSLRELWGGVATFVRPQDVQELQYALETLIRQPLRRRDLASQAQCRAFQFHPKRLALDYLDAYASVLRGRTTDARKEVLCAS